MRSSLCQLHAAFWDPLALFSNGQAFASHPPCFVGSTGVLRVLRLTRRACESGIDYAKVHQPEASQSRPSPSRRRITLTITGEEVELALMPLCA